MAAAIAAAYAARSAVRIRTAAARVAAQAKPGGLPFRISSHRAPSPRILRSVFASRLTPFSLSFFFLVHFDDDLVWVWLAC